MNQSPGTRTLPAALLCALLGTGCLTDPDDAGSRDARIQARPHTPSASFTIGTSTIGNASGGTSRIYVPGSYRRDEPMPVVVLLHGAGRTASEMAGFAGFADEHGFILVLPKSNGQTWDVAMGGFGADVDHLNNMLDYVFDRMTVQPGAVAIGGFSDGASYALSLGLTNGDLFESVVAFSPGFMQTPERRGKPRVFISHGTTDAVLPVSNTRNIVESLRGGSYAVRFEEFTGGHTVPPAVAELAMSWLRDF